MMIWAASMGREICMRKFLDHKVDLGFNDVSHIQRGRQGDDYNGGYSMLDVGNSDELEDQDTSRLTPLECAVQRGHVGVTKLLIDAGANVNAHGAGGTLPVIWAVGQAQAEILAVLLVAGAETNIEIDVWGTLLAYAAAHGHAEIVRLLLPKGTVTSDCNPNPYTRNELKESLSLAVPRNHKDVVRVFVETGTNINDPVCANETPLDIAGCHDLEDMVDLLFELGANVQALDHNGEPPLHTAIQKGHLATVIALLDRGASIEARDKFGSTPLGAAVLRDYTEIAKVLLEWNADIKALEYDGDTPLLLAARYGSTRSVKLLLGRGADPNATDDIGYTPLCLAVLGRHVEIVLELLGDDEKPSPTSNYRNERSWQAKPCSGSHFIDAPDSMGRTPLFFATLFGYTEIVRLLLCRGSNAIRTPTSAGRTPLSFADANKDKRPHSSREHDNLRSIFDLLQNPSQATVDTLAPQIASMREQIESDDETHTVECNNCLAPISDYDDPFVCEICKCVHEHASKLCYECCAKQICHESQVARKQVSEHS
ncbi:hypothetical protein FQN54_003088 [Arachnomyces sp. PD_36]|nr:hypothetical protein FQN54_003088 [Arachnomyces sp. PD_36]